MRFAWAVKAEVHIEQLSLLLTDRTIIKLERFNIDESRGL